MQATLANLPMDQVQSAYAPSDPAYAENMRWAEEALVTAVFCIIICGAWGTLSIRYLAPFLLEKAQSPLYHLCNPQPAVEGPALQCSLGDLLTLLAAALACLRARFGQSLDMKNVSSAKLAGLSRL